jgi:hypothetical protein
MNMAVFWVVAPCSLVEVYRRFRGTYRPDDKRSKHGRDKNIFLATMYVPCANPDSFPVGVGCSSTEGKLRR